MTSKLTREQAEEVIEGLEGLISRGVQSVYLDMAIAGMRQLKATLDSEPVAEVVSIYGDPEAFGEREIRPLVGIQQMPYGTKLYRHAQPAPEGHLSRICAESYQVVGALAEALGIFNDIGVIKALDNLSAQKLIHNDVLPFSVPEESQPAPLATEALQSLRTVVADPRRLPRRKEWIGGQQYSYVLLEEVEALVEDACRAAMLQAGNSQVIPEGWTGNDKANAALMMLDRIETIDHVDDDRIDGIKRIVRELAAAPQGVK